MKRHSLEDQSYVAICVSWCPLQAEHQAGHFDDIVRMGLPFRVYHTGTYVMLAMERLGIRWW